MDQRIGGREGYTNSPKSAVQSFGGSWSPIREPGHGSDRANFSSSHPEGYAGPVAAIESALNTLSGEIAALSKMTHVLFERLGPAMCAERAQPNKTEDPAGAIPTMSSLIAGRVQDQAAAVRYITAMVQTALDRLEI